MNLADKISALAAERKSPDSERIWAQLAFCQRISAVEQNKYDALLEKTADFLLDAVAKNGVITRLDADSAEKMLEPMYAVAKSYKIGCVGHAHIDMNWMWGWQETVSVTVDTFRTILDLMKEYPTFTFAQSQASTYKIIEEYCPEMLDEIRERIREGRWELTASTWVETDKNMPNGESLVRHTLYTRKYLERLLGVDRGIMDIDFEPDTFGHNKNVPEILQSCGIKHYYHCRGYEGEYIYRWRSQSGAEALCYREPYWYNADISSDCFSDVPLFCDRYKIKTMLKVYGVGDHGGGPTRRDIEKLLQMASWPAMPEIYFGGFHEFFNYLETQRQTLPVVDGEKNFIFTGCYTTQTRIKAANRIAEKRLFESEALSSAALLLGEQNKTELFEKAWENTLFNHFHDILPGSGVRETREYALGLFQKTLAFANTNANMSMRAIAAAIDTSAFVETTDSSSRAEGAGVGWQVGENECYGLAVSERGNGEKRIFHFFNTTSTDYNGVANITVWDWAFDPARAQLCSADGEKTQVSQTGGGTHYWGHEFKTFAVLVKVPAFGYSTYVLSQAPVGAPSFAPQYDPRCDHINDDDIVLENSVVKAVFDRKTAQLISFTDKKSGTELCEKPSAFFRYIIENPMYGATAWRVGPYISDVNLNEAGSVRMYEIQGGGLRKWLKYSMPFGTRSGIDVTVTLEENSSVLEFLTCANFNEIGTAADGIPQLAFSAPLSYKPDTYRYDVAFGTIDRSEMRSDVPALSFASAVKPDGGAAMLITDNKYGYRGSESTLSVTLIRASFDPDPQPEAGMHKTRIGLCFNPDASPKSLLEASATFNHQIACVSVKPSSGFLPAVGSLLSVGGVAAVSGIKQSEDGTGLIVRIFGTSAGSYSLKPHFEVLSAFACDAVENCKNELSLENGGLCGEIGCNQTLTVLLLPKKAVDAYPEKACDDEFSRPWGNYRTISKADGYCIKTLTVKPGHRLSLQSHNFREEYWTVASGTGKAVVGDSEVPLHAGVSVHIPVGTRHRLINDGTTPLVVGEIQQGERLEENDIVRYEDEYGRA